MNIGVVQHNPVVGDFAGNQAALLAALENAAAQGAMLCVAPGWALCGGGLGNLTGRRVFAKANSQALQNFAAAHKQRGLPPVLMGVALSPQGEETDRQHAAVLVADGGHTVVARQCYGKPGMPEHQQKGLIPGEPCGMVRVAGHRFAVLLDDNAWQDSLTDDEDTLMDCLQTHSVEGICILGAQPYSHGILEQIARQAAVFAQKYQSPVFFANLVGGNDSSIFYGGSFACNAHGACMAQAPLFQEHTFVVAAESLNTQGAAFAAPVKEEALWQALVLGTRDFVHKCGMERVVLGLSGGLDSALVAAIAAEALGPGNVMGVLLPSPYSSQEGIDDALALAASLGIAACTLPIDPVMAAAHGALAGAFPPGISGLAAENIQARIRGLLLMAYANQFGAMLLNTSNKSEIAVGYSTLYGDSCGGLAVIADVYKTEAYALCHWLNRTQGRAVIPENILHKEPSAELRPDQKDSDSLPPYDVLDAILELFIEGGKCREDVAACGFDRAVVERVRALMNGAEFKRRQVAPALHVTVAPFGAHNHLPLAMRW